MRYKVEISSKTDRALESLPKPIRNRVLRRIKSLSLNPRPIGVVKLHGLANRWRIRVGDYRIVYEIHDDKLIILVIDIDHRRDVYRKG